MSSLGECIRSFASAVIMELYWLLSVSAFITVLAIYSKHPSPRSPHLSEWGACGKPLGLLDSFLAGVWVLYTLARLVKRCINGRSSATSNNSETSLSEFLLGIIFAILLIPANVWLWESIHSCRLDAPHIWWLTFAVVVLFDSFLIVFIAFVACSLCCTCFSHGSSKPSTNIASVEAQNIYSLGNLGGSQTRHAGQEG